VSGASVTLFEKKADRNIEKKERLKYNVTQKVAD
jgi:hypothetical protein